MSEQRDTNELRTLLQLDFLQDYLAGKVKPTEYSEIFLEHMPTECITESVELFLSWLDGREQSEMPEVQA